MMEMLTVAKRHRSCRGSRRCPSSCTNREVVQRAMIGFRLVQTGLIEITEEEGV